MTKDKVTKYFDENSDAWILSSYDGDGYDYPTARLRSEKTCEIIDNIFPDGHADILDLGCGGGNLAIKLAQQGFNVTGIDNSSVMLDRANISKSSKFVDEKVRDRLVFKKRDILQSSLPESSYDVLTALGLIGYLENDNDLFDEAYRLLKPGGIFIVSCRNRLFNMVSISDHTIREIEEGTAKTLVEEIQSLYQEVSDEDAMNFVNLLALSSNSLLIENAIELGERKIIAKPNVTMNIDARQHTPAELLGNAVKSGFKHKAYYGINPHALMASLNQLLPPKMYHVLSSSLKALDHLPVSLIWSSVFLGVFVKDEEHN